MSLSTKPTVSQFAAVLKVTNWYNLGIFLGAECHELDDIDKNHSKDPLRCLIELYKCMEKKGGDLLTWESIATACRQLNENALADKIHSEYITPALQQQQSDTQVSSLVPTDQATDSTTEMGTCSNHDDDDVEVIEAEKVEEIASEYYSLSIKYNTLLTNVKRAFNEDRLGEVQDCLKRLCGVPRLPSNEATVELVFDRVEEQCSLLSLDILRIVIEEYIPQNESLLADVDGFVLAIDTFKHSANMVALVQLIQQNRQQIATAANGCQKIIELKVRKFWKRFTAKKLEILLNELFQTLYHRMRHVTVKPGCICLSWIIPDIDTTKLVPVLPLELVRLIGVIYLHIGSDVIYNIEGEGCESVEAAMIQAIELKNMRAVELLLAVGCNPEVATYNGDNAVTNIVNVRAIENKESSSSGSSHSVDHVCILGHNQHVEAIINPSKQPECDGSYCSAKEINIHLYQEIEQLKQEIKQKASENALLKGTNEILIKESREKGELLPRVLIQYMGQIGFNIHTYWTRFMRLLGMRANDIIEKHRHVMMGHSDAQTELKSCLDEWIKSDPDFSLKKINEAIKFVNEHECAVTVFHLLQPELSHLMQDCDNINVVTSTLEAEGVIDVPPRMMEDGSISKEQLVQSFETFIAQKPLYNLFRLFRLLTRFQCFKRITTSFELECELCSLHEPSEEDHVVYVPLSPTLKGEFVEVIEEYHISVGDIINSITERQDNNDIRRYISRSPYCDDLERFAELNIRDVLQLYFRRIASVTQTNQLKKFLRRFGLVEEVKRIEDFEKTRNEVCATLKADKLIDKTLSFMNIDEGNTVTFTVKWEINEAEINEIEEILSFAFEELAIDVHIKNIRTGN